MKIANGVKHRQQEGAGVVLADVRRKRKPREGVHEPMQERECAAHQPDAPHRFFS